MSKRVFTIIYDGMSEESGSLITTTIRGKNKEDVREQAIALFGTKGTLTILPPSRVDVVECVTEFSIEDLYGSNHD